MAQLSNRFMLAACSILIFLVAVQADCTFKSSPPSNNTCGGIGSISSPSEFGAVQYFTDVERDCPDLCARHSNPPGLREQISDPGCVSFAFELQSGQCQLYTQTAAEMGFVSNPTTFGTHFDDIDCYDCPAQCPQKLNRDLLDNGDFELSEFYIGPWTVNGGGSGTGLTKGYKSKQAFECAVEGYCELYQKFRQCSGQFYRASWNYRITGNKKISMTIYFGNAELHGNPATTAWQYDEVWFQTDSYFVGLLDFTGSGPSSPVGAFDLDNVHVYPVASNFKPKANAPNLVTNGGFESGKLAPWANHVRQGHSGVVKNGLAGKYSYKYTGSGGGASNYISQRLKVKAGTRYIFRYEARRLLSQAQLPDVSIADRFYRAPDVSSQPKNYMFEMPFTPQTNTAFIRFYVQNGPLLIDNVSVKEMAK